MLNAAIVAFSIPFLFCNSNFNVTSVIFNKFYINFILALPVIKSQILYFI
ncbi:hypothetical protein Krac_1952 [Ktedonobacter racemifer DSM 44963]|uniref:Uncharacterized protein n=1 Tax=Ktedonobacter racemifer DSM 44963 TaxID=485913 RepID=D6U408_KTERA|nr:hypothetical protein Krac_1952 [Ktedonobacter racemifer DSM 44963]